MDSAHVQDSAWQMLMCVQSEAMLPCKPSYENIEHWMHWIYFDLYCEEDKTCELENYDDRKKLPRL